LRRRARGVDCHRRVTATRPFIRRFPGVLRCLACAGAVALFSWCVANFHMPGKGFTYLIYFGARHHAQFLPELKAVEHYEQPESIGYDAQWYVQIAMHPRLTDPVLQAAIDRLSYRSRRILFEWTAWAIGGGNPARVMNVFALQNVACWFILAVLLMRWLPPVSWGNVLRWACILFSFGLIFSVKRALLDGPSLLLTAAAMALIEARRPWLGACPGDTWSLIAFSRISFALSFAYSFELSHAMGIFAKCGSA